MSSSSPSPHSITTSVQSPPIDPAEKAKLDYAHHQKVFEIFVDKGIFSVVLGIITAFLTIVGLGAIESFKNEQSKLLEGYKREQAQTLADYQTKLSKELEDHRTKNYYKQFLTEKRYQ